MCVHECVRVRACVCMSVCVCVHERVRACARVLVRGACPDGAWSRRGEAASRLSPPGPSPSRPLSCRSPPPVPPLSGTRLSVLCSLPLRLDHFWERVRGRVFYTCWGGGGAPRPSAFQSVASPWAARGACAWRVLPPPARDPPTHPGSSEGPRARCLPCPPCPAPRTFKECINYTEDSPQWMLHY